jgi:hypothetical protein
MVVPHMRPSMARSPAYLVYANGVVVYGYMITRLRSWMGRWIGFDNESKGHQVYGLRRGLLLLKGV